ncbi:MAG: carboxypeptidase-like regulatory domain-containing protein, partial [Saprospiraceae bacterium]
MKFFPFIKNKNSSITLLSFLIIFFFCSAQGISQILEGQIVDEKNNGLEGVNLHFLNNSIGTSTFKDGSFVLNRSPRDSILVVQYTGYQNDTLAIGKNKNS